MLMCTSTRFPRLLWLGLQYHVLESYQQHGRANVIDTNFLVDGTTHEVLGDGITPVGGIPLRKGTYGKFKLPTW
jgi:hypothetical protein